MDARALLGLALLILAPACADDKGGGDPGEEELESGGELVDADGDGFFSDEDCNDSDASVRPGVPEVCDGIDNDCDDHIDEDIDSVWYEDRDGDGFGDDAAVVLACAKPEGAVPTGSDCDDGDATVFPGASEVCDGQDNNCDGARDEGLGEGVYWYADEDRDGYGDRDSDLEACSQPEGYVGNARDCADADPTVYPGAEELSGDGVVNDCDACWDDGLCALEDAAARLLGVVEDGAAGSALAGPGDLDGDGLPDAAVGAPGAEADGASRAGRVYLFAGRWVGDRGLDESVVVLSGPDTDARAGAALAGADLDGDGVGELLVGVPGLDEPRAGAGGVWLLSGPFDRDLPLAAEEHATGEEASDGAGSAVAVGEGTLAVGAPRWPSLDDYGAVYVLGPGAVSGDLSEAGARWEGAAFGDLAGTALTLGDLDGDGAPDLAVGAPGEDGGARGAGAARVLLDAWAGGSLGDADAVWEGEEASDGAGAALCALDLDGDGRAELAVGVSARDDAGDGSGAVYLLSTATGGGSLAGAEAVLWGEDDGCALGAALANGGDVDGDGLDDLLAGEPGCEAGDPETGTALLLRGPFSGGAEVVDHAVRWRGESRADQAGAALSTLGDVDGDGRADLLVGGPGSDEAASGGGLVWMLYGVGL